MKNICRASWINHSTAIPLLNLSHSVNIDWEATKTVFHADNHLLAGHTSRKTANLRTFMIKTITDTRPVAKRLMDTWAVYTNPICPRCQTSPEDGEHFWSCPDGLPTIANIHEEASNKFQNYRDVVPVDHTIWAMKGVITRPMAEVIHAHTLNNITENTNHAQMTNSYRKNLNSFAMAAYENYGNRDA